CPHAPLLSSNRYFGLSPTPRLFARGAPLPRSAPLIFTWGSAPHPGSSLAGPLCPAPLLAGAPCALMHRQLPGRVLGEAPLIFRCQHLADDRRGRLRHETANLAAKFGEHGRMLLNPL